MDEIQAKINALQRSKETEIDREILSLRKELKSLRGQKYKQPSSSQQLKQPQPSRFSLWRYVIMLFSTEERICFLREELESLHFNSSLLEELLTNPAVERRRSELVETLSQSHDLIKQYEDELAQLTKKSD